ncbi:uncharacterized protein LOC117239571 [Bombus vosnesenskii]|uniref:Uncharacterized protein LOC117239571 n=1 Tax=Bombus vosnesenskii TaxID=207650 RepID=A0A6J3L7C8_9HYME|nr:uncharacterized protein LOC117239571 [Bombus vosnesenskii]XP_033361145.1 uncharacterized protein LOC117239571 [Bombus vosnesenskii]XP_033361146.1 uncharacterized protein LOC117239571 [Bombus vosnesenskii]
MSRPILSRPRTRVYGCNYDKGESYYKPMVDHLDRKYSSRPLFSEPRTSLADEIAARRGDIGTHDLSGPRNTFFGRDLDLELDPSIRASQLPLPSLTTDNLFPEDEDIVYDSRGQRSRRRFAENFANDVVATTQHLKAKLATFGLEDEVDAVLRKPRRLRQGQDQVDNILSSRKNLQDIKSISEEAETTFKRRSKLFDETDRLEESKPMLTKWSKLINEDESSVSANAAATRAMQTKARLNDLESEMEELAERQAKRERRAAALRALINENMSDTENFQEQSVHSKKVSIREHSEKHVL